MSKPLVEVKVKLPSKKKIAELPDDMWRDLQAMMEPLGRRLTLEIRRRVMEYHRGSLPGGEERPLPMYSRRYAARQGESVDYHRTGQLMSSIQPRILSRKGKISLVIKPYGRRAIDPPEKVTARNVRYAQLAAVRWEEGGIDALIREMDDYGYLSGDRQTHTTIPERGAVPTMRYWVGPHQRSGSNVGSGDAADFSTVKRGEATKRQVLRQRTGSQNRQLPEPHQRSATTVSGHWRTLPETVGFRGRGATRWWGRRLSDLIVVENRKRAQAANEKQRGTQNAQVADALSRRLGKGRWARPGQRVSPFITFSASQIQAILKQWWAGPGKRGRSVLEQAFEQIGTGS
jgi:hypothetical protein